MVARAPYRLRLVALALGFAAVARATPPVQRTDVAALIARVEGDAESARVARAPLVQARRALDRARNARGAGDQQHGALLEALAGEWAQTAADLARAAAAEKKLADLQRETSETETKVVRARALLEETVARVGRARQKLRELESDPKASGSAP